jgi:hypothetical protein
MGKGEASGPLDSFFTRKEIPSKRKSVSEGNTPHPCRKRVVEPSKEVIIIESDSEPELILGTNLPPKTDADSKTYKTSIA